MQLVAGLGAAFILLGLSVRRQNGLFHAGLLFVAAVGVGLMAVLWNPFR